MHLRGRRTIALETLDSQTKPINFVTEDKRDGKNELGFCFQWERDQWLFLPIIFFSLLFL